MADLSGSWLGTYWQQGQPTRFEGSLVQGGNTLSGRILDDGPLAESEISGTVSGRRVSFVKRYLASQNAAIEYTGIISEDGNYISGQWSINRVDSGDWEAHRNDDELLKSLTTILEKQATTAVPATSLSLASWLTYATGLCQWSQDALLRRLSGWWLTRVEIAESMPLR
jgi:hypothetical protein